MSPPGSHIRFICDPQAHDVLQISRPRPVLLIAFVTLMLGLAADVDDIGPLLRIAGLVAIVAALVVIALLLPDVVAGGAREEPASRHDANPRAPGQL